jgi:phage terminase large subunit-like protein
MGDEAGIIVAGKYNDNGYILADKTLQGSPLKWAEAAVAAFNKYKANRKLSPKRIMAATWLN